MSSDIYENENNYIEALFKAVIWLEISVTNPVGS
jgi:hypothetical protein